MMNCYFCSAEIPSNSYFLSCTSCFKRRNKKHFVQKDYLILFKPLNSDGFIGYPIIKCIPVLAKAEDVFSKQEFLYISLQTEKFLGRPEDWRAVRKQAHAVIANPETARIFLAQRMK